MIPKQYANGIAYYRKAVYAHLTRKGGVKFRIWVTSKLDFDDKVSKDVISCPNCITEHMLVLLDSSGLPVIHGAVMKAEPADASQYGGGSVTAHVTPRTPERSLAQQSDISFILQGTSPAESDTVNQTELLPRLSPDFIIKSEENAPTEMIPVFPTRGLGAMQNDDGAEALLEAVHESTDADPTAVQLLQGDTVREEDSDVQLTPRNFARSRIGRMRLLSGSTSSPDGGSQASSSATSSPDSCRSTFKYESLSWYLEFEYDYSDAASVTVLLDNITQEELIPYVEILRTPEISGLAKHQAKIVLGSTDFIASSILDGKFAPYTTKSLEKLKDSKRLKAVQEGFEVLSHNSLKAGDGKWQHEIKGRLDNLADLTLKYMNRMISDHQWNLDCCYALDYTLATRHSAHLEKLIRSFPPPGSDRPNVRLIVLQGPTGSGKSTFSMRFAEMKYGAYYRRTSDQMGNFNRYNGEKVCIIEETSLNQGDRGSFQSLSHAQLLNLTSPGYCELPCKFGSSAVLFELIFIVTMRDLKSQMIDDPVGLAAYERRICWVGQFDAPGADGKMVPPTWHEGPEILKLRQRGIDEPHPTLPSEFYGPNWHTFGMVKKAPKRKLNFLTASSQGSD